MRERMGSVMRVTAPVKAAAQRLAFPFLIVLSALLIVLGKADLLFFDRLRIGVVDAVSPLLEGVSRPVAAIAAGVQSAEGVVHVWRENVELREENARLLQWQAAARRLAAENAALRALAKLSPEGAASYVSAQVIGDSGGAFARNVLVRAGTREGIARGQAAMTGDGLVGRVAEVGERTSRVLLLTDLNSRVPVALERSRERAVLAGDNSDRPRLLYLPSKSAARIGERIVTSGSGGVFPPDLPVGVIAAVDGDVVRVEPFAELERLDYLRIVDFGLAGALPESVVPPPKAAKRASARTGAAEAPR